MSTDGKFKGYTVVEEALYSEQIEALGGAEVFDGVLSAVYWALCNNPTQFWPVPLHLNLYIVKTNTTVTISGRSIPALRIHFSIYEIEGGSLIALKSIEAR